MYVVLLIADHENIFKMLEALNFWDKSTISGSMFVNEDKSQIAKYLES